MLFFCILFDLDFVNGLAILWFDFVCDVCFVVLLGTATMSRIGSMKSLHNKSRRNTSATKSDRVNYRAVTDPYTPDNTGQPPMNKYKMSHWQRESTAPTNRFPPSLRQHQATPMGSAPPSHTTSSMTNAGWNAIESNTQSISTPLVTNQSNEKVPVCSICCVYCTQFLMHFSCFLLGYIQNHKK